VPGPTRFMTLTAIIQDIYGLDIELARLESGLQPANGSQSQPMAQDIVDMYDATDGSLVIKHHE
jgi:hypothetical protein